MPLIYTATMAGLSLWVRHLSRVRVTGGSQARQAFFEGLPASGPYLICANHLGPWDGPAIKAFLRPPLRLGLPARLAPWVLLDPASFGHQPFSGWFPRVLGRGLVIRQKEGIAGSRRVIDRSVEVLERGEGLLLFPEGSRDHGGDGACSYVLGQLLLRFPGIPIFLIRLSSVQDRGGARSVQVVSARWQTFPPVAQEGATRLRRIADSARAVSAALSF